MEAAERNYKTKLIQLHMNGKKMNHIIDGDNSEAIERHLQTLKKISDTVNHLTLDVKAKK